MANTDPRDPWPHADRETEYRLLFPAAVATVAEILEVAQTGAGTRLREAEAEAVPAPWPDGQGPDPQTPAGALIELYNELYKADIDFPGIPGAELQQSWRLLGQLNGAIWCASRGAWQGAAHEVKRALRNAWKVTGLRA